MDVLQAVRGAMAEHMVGRQGPEWFLLSPEGGESFETRAEAHRVRAATVVRAALRKLGVSDTADAEFEAARCNRPDSRQLAKIVQRWTT